MERSLIKIIFYLSLLISVIFIFSGYGYQWGIWELGTGFTLLRYGAFAAMGLLVIHIILAFFLKKLDGIARAMVGIGLFLTLGVSATAIYFAYQGQGAPPIHDITTDMQSPPEFVDVARLRESAPNPPGYEGEETARIQREAYPDIQPLVTPTPKQEVIDEIVKLIANEGWDIVSINRQEGRIESTEKLAWFGFKDDVVIRVMETDEGTRVDMRSKSRIGAGDLGVNANRIEQLMEDLQDRVNE
ncbi:MAG: DUF1499 domain-containing protein [Balneolales bacterium]